ncbi:MAG: hypothetical protein CL843_13210 [Crocinitomicaceae bacterium]|nr:hypothetical protein [Crocinitomicaceae bacterium]|tara:strand:+ start:7713 stop:8231 length:519 start_codon:yes stop_codon:yes gene_type:complete
MLKEKEDAYYALPQPEELTEREKEDAMGAYLMMFASIAAGLPLPVINLIAAVIYYFLNRGKSRFIHFHALQSLITQIPISLINAGFVFWTINNFIVNKMMGATSSYFIYLSVAVVLNIIYFVFSIVAAIAARKGRMYYFLIFGSLSYNAVYRKISRLSYSHEPEDVRNEPPR